MRESHRPSHANQSHVTPAHAGVHLLPAWP